MAKKKEAYLFLSAMLRAREPGMLSREKAERMLDAPSFEECAKLLTDCGYEDMSQKKAGEIEQLLAERRAAIGRELESMVPEKALVDFFRVKYDYHNAKVILKAEAQNLDESALLSPSGRVKPEALLEAVREDDFRELPKDFAAAVQEAKSILARTANPQLADFSLDKAYFGELQALADTADSSFLRGYAAILADSTNLRSAVRTLRMGKDSGYLQEA
ncbi:MAG: V-type ATPase subunit, partial [Oscillospiraceae bacterium]|nr:V-type ATPase subunit [Oscillospiraceae bacterium]